MHNPDDTSADSAGHTFIYQDPFGKFSFVITGLSAAVKQLDVAATDCKTAFERINETFRRLNLEKRRFFVEACRPEPTDPSKAARWFDCFRTYAEPADVTPGVDCRRVARSLTLMPSRTEQRRRKRRRFIHTINHG